MIAILRNLLLKSRADPRKLQMYQRFSRHHMVVMKKPNTGLFLSQQNGKEEGYVLESSMFMVMKPEVVDRLKPSTLQQHSLYIYL